MKIIYPNDAAGVAVIHCSGELPVDQVARKDVPAGLPYLIVEDDAIPADRTFREAWAADFSVPHGHGVGPVAWDQEFAELSEAAARVSQELQAEVDRHASARHKGDEAKRRAVAAEETRRRAALAEEVARAAAAKAAAKETWA